METFNINIFTRDELIHAERAISHILSLYNERSRPLTTDLRVFDSVVLSSSQAAALTKVLINICTKIYD